MDDSGARHAPPPAVLRGHGAPVASVCALGGASSGLLASADAQGGLLLWSLGTRRAACSARASAPHDGVLAVRAASGFGEGCSEGLLTQSRAGVVRAWALGGGGELRTSEEVEVIDTAATSLCQMAVADRGRTFAVAAADNGVAELWDLRAGRRVATAGAVERAGDAATAGRRMFGACTALCFACEGGGGGGRSSSQRAAAMLVAGFEGGAMRAFDMRRPDVALPAVYDAAASECEAFTQPVLSLAAEADTRRGGWRLAAGGADTSGALLALGGGSSDTGGGSLGVQQRLMARRAGDCAAVALRGDGRCAAAGGWDGAVRVFAWKGGRALVRLRYHSDAVSEVAFLPDGAAEGDVSSDAHDDDGEAPPPRDGHAPTMLASGSRDGTVALWTLRL